MVEILDLWLPIVLSGIIVWIVSAIFWTVSPHHKHHFKKVENEEGARTALRGLAPGFYWIPFSEGNELKENTEVQQKYIDGPVAGITVVPSGMPSMGKPMVLSLLYYFVIGYILAYIASRTLVVGAPYMTVFRLVGTVAWVAYWGASIPESIWFGRPWRETAKTVLDALVYALLTAGAFAGFWPEA